MPHILLKGATAVLTKGIEETPLQNKLIDVQLYSRESDILIGDDGTIQSIEPAIPHHFDKNLDNSTEIIDCSGLIAIPGMIDTHRHVSYLENEYQLFTATI